MGATKEKRPVTECQEIKNLNADRPNLRKLLWCPEIVNTRIFITCYVVLLRVRGEIAGTYRAV